MTDKADPYFRPLVRMTARRRDEAHRAATPLELLFDLCFVVAVAQAGARLAEALAEGHTGAGIGHYAVVFFAIWWAWMNFTWFASAYDTDDVPYRLLTMLQITGVLVLAAGVTRAFDGHFGVAVAGYIIMRTAQAAQWLRAAHAEQGPARTTALRYAGGLVVVQLGWVILLFVPAAAFWWAFGFLILAELAVPAYAELPYQTSWHPRHIGERYGLFTIIVLGESIAASVMAVESALAGPAALNQLLPTIVGGLLIVFAAFWIYFAVPIHRHLVSNRQGFRWGYGHYFIFGSAAAVGSGIEVVVLEVIGAAHVPPVAAAAAVTVPTALFLGTVWFLHARYFKRTMAQQLVLPVSTVLVLVTTLAGHWAVLLAGLVAASAVAVGVTLAARPVT